VSGELGPARHPEHAVALVMADSPDGGWLGTAVRFRSPHFFITCAHVVADYIDQPERISFSWLGELQGPGGTTRTVVSGGVGTVNQITLHPNADLAVVRCQVVSRDDPRRPLLHVAEQVQVGEPVKVLGFTRDMMSEGTDGVIPLALTVSDGAIKQISREAKPVGKPYLFESAILNDTIERGMSGGAVVDAWRSRRLIGLATGESSSDEAGKELGWILRLGPYRTWLEQQVHCSHGHDDWGKYPTGFACSHKRIT